MAQKVAAGLEDEDGDLSVIMERLNDLNQSDLQRILDRFNKKVSLTIVVSGRTGVGKSTLIGSLLGMCR